MPTEPRSTHDLIVVGAGVNGAAIARDAALRGLRVCLVEADDVASGTSAWSSRLVHGGIRYLEHGEVRLVRESLRERELLLRNAPHLVAPYPLLIPFYAHNRRAPTTLRAGMLAYDLLSADKTTPWHRLVGRRGIRRWPGLATEGWQGGALYHDAQAPYAERLAVENVLSALESGADVRTHTAVVGLAPGPRTEVRTRAADGAEAVLTAPVVVNAAGPSVDAVLQTGGAGADPGRRLIGGTKGSHLVLDPFPGAPDTGVHYEAHSDHRAVLVLPWAGRYLIGSTDRYFTGDPTAVRCSDEEVDYLLAETNRLIPQARLTPGDVLYSYSGVRPLPHAPAAGSEADVSRDHQFVEHGPGVVVSVVGGKLTTHRALAEQAVDLVVRRLGTRRRSVTRRVPLPGARTADWPAFARALRADSPFSARTTEHLLAVYGVRAQDVLALAAADPRLAKVLPGEDEALAAEVVHAFTRERAGSLVDALHRRTMVGLDRSVGLDTAAAAAQVAVEVVGWSDARADEEVAAHRRYVHRFRPRGLEED